MDKASLSAERAEQIRRLFDQVVDLDPDQRAALLDQACRDDDALRHAVDALLQADLRADEVLHKLDDPAGTAHEERAPETDPLIDQSWDGSAFFIRIEKNSPPGPPPMQTIFTGTTWSQ